VTRHDFTSMAKEPFLSNSTFTSVASMASKNNGSVLSA